MPGTDLPFSAAEYATRLTKTRKAMDAKGVDLLWVTDPSNMSWLTGYDGWSFYVHQGVLVPPDGLPIWWGRNQDANGAYRTVYMNDDHVLSYPDIYVQSTERHPMDQLSGIIEDRGWGTLRIGIEMDNYYFSAKAFQSLQQHLPNAKFVDTTGLVNWQRGIKSETEIAYMRKAAKIVDRMHGVIAAKMEPGIRKCDIVADIFHTGIEGTPEYGGDYPAIVPLLPTGPNAAAPHLTWDDAPMETGAGTFFEIAGCYKRYHTPLSRTVFLGKPPQHIIDAEKSLLDGLQAGIEAAVAGNRACDIANALAEELRKGKIERSARCGYAIGISYPPDWGERTISFRETDQTVLKPGMTFHFMPGLWMESWGLEITESILIKESGPAECLTSYPREMIIKE